jgi:aminoacyl tRNA synthase complex-interacting multifunctional protein 1
MYPMFRLLPVCLQDGKAAKDAKKKGGGSSKTGPAPDAPVDIARLDLRVGQIAKVWRHPAADR